MTDIKRPNELRIVRMRLGSEELIVVSVPSLEPTLPGDLTRAERGVASLLLAGMSNRDIARVRGVSVRTVANQAAAIFRKIGIRRRAQLGGGLLHADTA